MLLQKTQNLYENIINESHQFAIDILDKSVIAEKSWCLFELLYDYIGGFKSYTSVQNMAEEVEFLKFVYDGPLFDMKNFQIQKCYAIGTYNHNHGIKMTAIATNLVCYDKIKAKAAAIKLQKESLKFSWVECSEKAEEFIMKVCGGTRYVINPNIIKNEVYPDRDVIITSNNHYKRLITNVGYVQKIAIGTIQH